MVFATFNQNNKEYVYIFQEGKIVYGYRVNGKIYIDLTMEEKNLMNRIYNKFMISTNKENHRKCGTINHNGKKYQIFYDKVSKRKFFFEIGENGYNIPDSDTYLYLDSYFNPEYVCEEGESGNSELEENNQNANKENYERKRNSIQLRVAMGMLSLILTITGLGLERIQQEMHKLKYQKMLQIEVENAEETKSIEDLEKAVLGETVYNNKHLSSEEKEFVLSNFTVIEENRNYLNLSLIYNRLCDLEFIYDPKEKIDENGYRIKGCYTKDNKIIIYNCSSFEEAITKDRENMEHETFHSFTSHFSSLGDKTYEALNEIIILEYGMHDLQKGTYLLERKAVYLLIELLGPEVCREFYCKDDAEILIDKLVEIIDDEDKAYELLGMIDNLKIEKKELMKNNPKLGERQINSMLYEPINRSINDYFVAKYGYDMMEDEIMQNYLLFQGTDKVTLENSTSIQKALLNFQEQRKGAIKDAICCGYNTSIVLPYFSEEYKNKKFPDGIVKQYLGIRFVVPETGGSVGGVFGYDVEVKEREKGKTK